MKRMTRSILAVLLCAALLLPISANAVGPVTNEDHEAVVELLQSIEPAKAAFGIGHVDFTCASIGEKIHSYEYVDGSLIEIRTAYPLFDGNALFGLALQTDTEDYQFTTAYVDDINSLGVNHVAFVFDSTYCYLYDGIDLFLLEQNPYVIETRDVLSINNSSVTGNAALCDLSETTPLGYFSTATSRSTTEVICRVEYVSQMDQPIC